MVSQVKVFPVVVLFVCVCVLIYFNFLSNCNISGKSCWCVVVTPGFIFFNSLFKKRILNQKKTDWSLKSAYILKMVESA